MQCWIYKSIVNKAAIGGRLLYLCWLPVLEKIKTATNTAVNSVTVEGKHVTVGTIRRLPEMGKLTSGKALYAASG